MKYRLDDSQELAKLAQKIIKKEEDYAPLKLINVLYIWREGKPKKDPDGNGFVAAEVSVPSSRLRDILGIDAQIEVSEPIWLRLSDEWKFRVLWHELRHLNVELDDEDGRMVPARDKEKRILVNTVPHDISLRTFKAEISAFGVDLDEIKQMRFISKCYRQAKKEKLKKYARPNILRDELEEDTEDPEENES